MQTLQDLKKYFKENEKTFLKDYFTFLKFQTISSEKDYMNEMKNCADWLTKQLTHLQFDVKIWNEKSAPILFASNEKVGPEAKTLLIYHHYDVQPVDPLELWNSPPFEPTIKGSEVFARGAQDNKGQCFYTLFALKALIQGKSAYPLNIKICIEGEEECGSPGLLSLLSSKSEDLKADYLAVVDLGTRSLNKPTMTLGIRGIVTLDLEVHGAKTDSHSGTNGGLLFNPNHALVEILAGIRDKEGHIQIPGFYEGVEDLNEENKKSISFDFDEKEYEEITGAPPTGGEKNYSPLERNWVRPTVEINGISGGYSGFGFKTVIPAFAKAKISCRLVANQDPEKILRLITEYFKSQEKEGIKVIVHPHEGIGSALFSKIDSKVVQSFKKSYERVFEKSIEFIYEGASIPVLSELAKTSKAEVALIGLGLQTDCIHAPNEHFGLDRLELGYLIMADAIQNL